MAAKIIKTDQWGQMVTGLFLTFLFSLPFMAIACLAFSSLRITSATGLLRAMRVGFFEFGITFVGWLTTLRLSKNAGK